MTAWQRWCKFNVVGAFGMVLQLAVLATLKNFWRGHYLFASACAVEAAVLHNVTWHIHYTWRDRRNTSHRLAQLGRFHLSNGLVSMLGNLLLMRLLVRAAHLPVMLSNMVAIACCSLLNFTLSDRWTFGRTLRVS